MSKAPWWVWSLVMGTVFGLFEVLSNLGRGRSVAADIIGGVVGGALFGAIMGPVMARQSRRNREVFASVPQSDRRAVARSALRGPLPTDPDLRLATARYARSVVDRNTAARQARSVAICVAFVALSVVVASQDGQWWFLAVGVFFAGLGVFGLVTQTRMRRRLALLETGQPRTERMR